MNRHLLSGLRAALERDAQLLLDTGCQCRCVGSSDASSNANDGLEALWPDHLHLNRDIGDLRHSDSHAIWELRPYRFRDRIRVNCLQMPPSIMRAAPRAVTLEEAAHLCDLEAREALKVGTTHPA